jgi:hypothetical protein
MQSAENEIGGCTLQVHKHTAHNSAHGRCSKAKPLSNIRLAGVLPFKALFGAVERCVKTYTNSNTETLWLLTMQF